MNDFRKNKATYVHPWFTYHHKDDYASSYLWMSKLEPQELTIELQVCTRVITTQG